MSFIRIGDELNDFQGESQLYIYSDGERIIDYGEEYNHNPSYAQFLINTMRMVIQDEKFIEKQKKVLAEKLYVEPKDKKD